MGGTFDPIHHGHLVAASEVANEFGLDEVLFVPTGTQPFKADRQVTQAEHRYLMTVIATASNPRFSASRVEIDREGITYTVDTLRQLRGQYPDADLFFITGADALSQIAQWKDVNELWSLAHFVGVTRPGHEADVEPLPPGEFSLLEIPAMAISSTDCRERVQSGKPVWYLVPDGVVQYIGKHGLYLNSSTWTSPSVAPRRLTAVPEDTHE
ncbi:MAG: nicotinate-nucleotide adenylyltransferase [Beutenbergiaceae bacterium]